jgi:SNF2 family DNA or RNA helicase
MILSPVSPQTSTVARVFISGNLLLCKFRETNDLFKKQVRGLGLSWDEKNMAYSRKINQDMAGTPFDRAAELTAKLVNAGFICESADDIAQAARCATWQPEHTRWVESFDGRFHLHWRKSSDENLYHRALMLPEARYDSDHKTVSVSAFYFGEVIGFAEEHDFRFTPAAERLIEQAKRDYQRVIVPEIAASVISKKRITLHASSPQKFMDMPERRLATKTDLFPHQISAVEKILPSKLGALFMDMGTGKTRCAIELVTRRQARTSRVIWFCPVSLKLTIAMEIEKHTSGESVYIFDDATSSDNLPDAFWYVVGIESMSSSDRVVVAIDRLIDSDTFVIVDESTYIKGHASRRSLRIAEISKRARYRLLMTGTPITQGVEDLYSQMRFLSLDILGYSSFYSFANNHLEYSDKFPGLIVRAHNMDKIAERIMPYVYQVTKDECMDLPEKLYDQIWFELTEEQHEAYARAKEEILLGREDDDIDSVIIFKLFTALQQIVSGFWNRNGNEFIRLPHKRIETLKTVIDGIPENEKVIIWCKYIESVNQISVALKDCALYYGDLSETERDAQLTKFRSQSRFLVATMSSGGHGLTLNEARYHIFYENEFKYSHRIQAEDRSHRIGQTRSVTYIDIISHSGIDRRIHAALSKKKDVVKSFRRKVKKIKDVREI